MLVGVFIPPCLFTLLLLHHAPEPPSTMAQKFNAMVSSYKDHFMERPSPSPLDTSAPTPLRLFDVLGENDPDLWNHSVTAAEHAASDGLARKRREAIRDGFLHAWRGYSSKAWGADEIRPRSGLPKDNWGGIGMTILDSLSTLWLLGLETDFSIARDWVANNLSFHSAKNVSTFETTIRGEPNPAVPPEAKTASRSFLTLAKLPFDPRLCLHHRHHLYLRRRRRRRHCRLWYRFAGGYGFSCICRIVRYSRPRWAAKQSRARTL